MKKGVSVLYFIIFIVVVAIIVFVYNSIGIYNVVNDEGVVTQESADSAQLALEYEKNLAEIILEYKTIIINKDVENIKDVHDKLLAITGVPKEYMNSHAELVLSLDSLADNQDFAVADEKLQKMAKQYEWLKYDQ